MNRSACLGKFCRFPKVTWTQLHLACRSVNFGHDAYVIRFTFAHHAQACRGTLDRCRPSVRNSQCLRRSQGRVRRRHAAILVAGYSRLSPGDEKQNFAELRAFVTGVIRPQIAEFGGNIFKEAAELVLADFDNVVKAAHCAAGLRDQVAQSNQTLAEEDRIAIRVGINFGEVIEEEGDVFGDGVNIAARVGALAKPGSVYLSETVHDKVAGENDLDFEDLGPQDLKNISRPIRVYRMAGDDGRAVGRPSRRRRQVYGKPARL